MSTPNMSVSAASASDGAPARQPGTDGSGGPIPFGTMPDGRHVRRVTLRAGALRATIIEYGAAIQDLRIAGHDAPVVLGFESLEDYRANRVFLGAIAGRVANRIRDGRFVLEGRRYQADCNFLGKHMLHGGTDGYDRQVWTLTSHTPDEAVLTLHDPDGHMGFPGAVDVTCRYKATAPATLTVELTATTDRATLVGLAPHSYFNLDNGGSGDILDHRLCMPAAAYLPVDDELIPTGVVQPVESTDFDFRIAREIGSEGSDTARYDHNFCIASARGPLRQVAWVQGGGSGLEMEVWSTEPGVQFYAGQYLDVAAAGLGGRRYGRHSGFCLEPQLWPDAPNHPYFPPVVLEPEQTYRAVTEYRFRLD